jgi:SRSO17 transposase
MRKIFLLLIPAFIFAQSFMISNIPLPKSYIQDLDPYDCSEECLQTYLDNGMIFSFLAHAHKKLANKELDDARVMNISVLNIGAFNTSSKLSIALLLPYKKIGKYAASTTNATFAYLMTRSNAFELKSYKVESESLEDLQAAFSKIQEDGFGYVIAPLTKKGVENVIALDPDANIYFPTINKHDVNESTNYMTFGGIDYEKQSKLLLKEAVSPLVIFSDRSNTGQKLARYQEEEFLHPTIDVDDKMTYEDEISVYATEEEAINEKMNVTEEKKVIKYFISKRTTNLEHYLKENEKIVDGSFFINTPIIKSGMIMSQLTLYDTNVTNILSTQINYDPLLLSMTQYVDREKMIIANSITQENNTIIESNALLGNDIRYDWINYTTTVGIDYFYNKITGGDREYNIEISDNQMIYDVELLRPGLSKFSKYIPQTIPDKKEAF